ncbi:MULTISPECIES: TetR/AcrR family transcriptional regulator C-terminal domain-containing protein [unclassified Streptomyces]|uniref:TetR/AcrR family transcriptional regulator C-terminal domain-containing protein n=1 Tax=unclassified Streptomyces TaxID=2593676 RepID=UPI003369C6C3
MLVLAEGRDAVPEEILHAVAGPLVQQPREVLAQQLDVVAVEPAAAVRLVGGPLGLVADAGHDRADSGARLDESYPADPPTDWRPRLELAAHTLWALYRKHPWLAQTGPLTRPLLLPNLMVHAEWVLATLDGHGLDPKTVLDLHVLLYSYIQGIAVHLEQEAQAEAATGLSEDEWMDRQSQALQAITASPRYPAFTRLTASLSDGYDLRLDELFELGLGTLLDGVAVIIKGR